MKLIITTTILISFMILTFNAYNSGYTIRKLIRYGENFNRTEELQNLIEILEPEYEELVNSANKLIVKSGYRRVALNIIGDYKYLKRKLVKFIETLMIPKRVENLVTDLKERIVDMTAIMVKEFDDEVKEKVLSEYRKLEALTKIVLAEYPKYEMELEHYFNQSKEVITNDFQMLSNEVMIRINELEREVNSLIGYINDFWEVEIQVHEFSKRYLKPEDLGLTNQLSLNYSAEVKKLIELGLSASDSLTAYSAAMYNILNMYQQGISAGFVLYLQLSADQVLIELFIVQVMMKFSIWLLKETVFRATKLGVLEMNYWMFGKLWAEFSQAQFFEGLGQSISMMMIMRIFLNVVHMPYLFVLNYVYVILFMVLYGFYVIIMNISTDIKYKIEIKVDAAVRLDDTKVKKITVIDSLTMVFLKNALNFVPFIYRIARSTEPFRPLENLMAPTKIRYYSFIILLIPLVCLTFIVDILITMIMWLIVWLWITPYLKNRNIAQDKWDELVNAGENQYAIINGIQVYEAANYFYNSIRIWALVFGWYSPTTERISTSSNLYKFFEDFKLGYPNRKRTKETELKLPVGSLENLEIPDGKELTNKEKSIIHLNYLKKRGAEINPNAEYPELVLYCTSYNNSTERELASDKLDKILFEKYGEHYARTYTEVPRRTESTIVIGKPADVIPVDIIKGIAIPYLEDILFNAEHCRRIDDIVEQDLAMGKYIPRGEDELLYQIIYRLHLRSTGRDLIKVKPIPLPQIENMPTPWKLAKDSIDLFICINRKMTEVFDPTKLIYRDLMVTDNMTTEEYLEVILANDYKQRKIDDEIGELEYLDSLPEFRYTIARHNYRLKEEPMWYSYLELSKAANEFKIKYGVMEGDLYTIWKLADTYGQVSNPKEERFLNRIVLLENCPQHANYITGTPLSDYTYSDEVERSLRARISRSNLHYAIFLKWILSFDPYDRPKACIWFMLNNTMFLKRFFLDKEVNEIFESEGIDINKNLQYVKIVEKDAPQIQETFIDNLKKEMKKIVTAPLKDDDYIELDEWREKTMTYGNHEGIRIMKEDTFDRTDFGGLQIIGKQTIWTGKAGKIFFNKAMESEIQYFGVKDTKVYIMVDTTSELLARACAKYKPRKLSFDHGTSFNGYYFRAFLHKWMDYFYHLKSYDKFPVRSNKTYSEEDLGNNPRAFPGPLSRQNGIIYKNHEMDKSRDWADAYRKSITTAHPLDHIWTLLPIPKPSKPGNEEVRAVLAPEMYFYINQQLLIETFVKLSKNSMVTGNFQPFFGGFDFECRKLIRDGYMIESLDITNQGGSIQPMIYKAFVDWWGSHLENPADKFVLEHIYKNIFKGKVMVSTAYGGYVLNKESGYGDGPYGTADFDTWVMIYYYIANVWMNLVADGISPANFDLGRHVNIRSHADNWIHSYNLEYDRYLRWKVSNLTALGQTVKGEICHSMDIKDHELMGFKIKEYENYLVGYRPFAKTVKSLIYNKRKFSTLDQQKAYEAGILKSLSLVDAHNPDSLILIHRLSATRNVQPMVTDIVMKDRIYVIDASGDPRDAWIKKFPLTEGDISPDDLRLF